MIKKHRIILDHEYACTLSLTRYIYIYIIYIFIKLFKLKYIFKNVGHFSLVTEDI